MLIVGADPEEVVEMKNVLGRQASVVGDSCGVDSRTEGKCSVRRSIAR